MKESKYYLLIITILKLTNCSGQTWLRCWIPNPGVPCSEPQGGFTVASAFHPSDFDQMSNGNFWELSEKRKLLPQNGSVALRQLNTIHKKKVPQSFFFIYKKYESNNQSTICYSSQFGNSLLLLIKIAYR